MKKKKECKILFFILLFIIPVLIAASFGPWIGLRGQATAPSPSANGVKLYVDSNNNLYSLHEDGSTVQLDSGATLIDPSSAGTLTIGSGSITDSSGAISFGNENLTTTGSLTFASGYLDGYLYRTAADNNTAAYLRDDRFSVYAGGRIMLDAIEAAQDLLYLGYDGSSDIDISIGPDACMTIEGSSKNITMSGGTLDLGADDVTTTLTIHDAGTIVMYDDSDDTTFTIGPVADGTNDLGLTGDINLTGKLGIGVSNPAYEIDVATANATTTIYSYSSHNTGSGIFLAKGDKGRLRLETSSASATNKWYEMRVENANGGELSISSLTSGWAGYSTQYIAVFKDGGKVGINGQSAPAVGLHIGTNASGHSLTSANDAIITGKVEVDGTAYFDSIVEFEGVKTKGYNESVADDANIVLPSFTNGCKGWIMIGNAEEYTEFWVDNDGDVTLVGNSANVVAGADTDTKVCVGTAATQEPLVVKNRLGGAKNFLMEIKYN